MSSINQIEKKNIKGYEGLYSATKDGRIWRHSKTRRPNSGFMKTVVYGRYERVNLTKDGIRKSHSVHRLVLMAYVENPKNKETVNHIDGNKLNNNLNNLEWATLSENIKHAYRTGIKKASKKQRDSARDVGISKRKLSIDEASEVCEAYATGIFTQKEIAESVGMAQSKISSIVRGETYA